MTRSSLFATFYASYCTKNILFYAVQRIYCIKSEKSHNDLDSLHCKTKTAVLLTFCRIFSLV